MSAPPYGVIWSQLQEGAVVPFLGAGASLVGRPNDTVWDAKSPTFLPSARELAKYLARVSSFPSKDEQDLDNLAKVASYFEDVSSRKVLRKTLREKLRGPFAYASIHAFLAQVPVPQLIVSTNYDDLLEQAFRKAGRRFDLVIHPADRMDIANAVLLWPSDADEPKVVETNELAREIDLERTTVIYKMHGTIDPASPTGDCFVITEEDYVEFLARMTTQTAIPPVFIEHFRIRSFLFLGYGLGDWNLRVILRNLRTELQTRRTKSSDDEMQSWAIQFKPSELEKGLWGRRNVRIYDVNLGDFVANLESARDG